MTATELTLTTLADGHLSIVRYPVSEVPSSHDEYSINFFPSGIVPEDEFDPDYLYLSYGSGHSSYNLRKLRGERRITPGANRWISVFLQYLRAQHFAVPDAPDTPASFRSPKKTCKSSVSSHSPDIPVSNSFEVLASAPAAMDVLQSAPSLEKPPLVSKKSVPPINIKISDPADISLLRSVLHPDTVLQYSTNRLRLRASSIEDYKYVLDFVNAQKWEFYTYNPVVLDTTKSVLRGLPPSIYEQDIQRALTDKGVHVLQVRQLWKSSQSIDGGWSKHPLPIWIPSLFFATLLVSSISGFTSRNHASAIPCLNATAVWTSVIMPTFASSSSVVGPVQVIITAVNVLRLNPFDRSVTTVRAIISLPPKSVHIDSAFKKLFAVRLLRRKLRFWKTSHRSHELPLSLSLLTILPSWTSFVSSPLQRLRKCFTSFQRSFVLALVILLFSATLRLSSPPSNEFPWPFHRLAFLLFIPAFPLHLFSFPFPLT